MVIVDLSLGTRSEGVRLTRIEQSGSEGSFSVVSLLVPDVWKSEPKVGPRRETNDMLESVRGNRDT